MEAIFDFSFKVGGGASDQELDSRHLLESVLNQKGVGCCSLKIKVTRGSLPRMHSFWKSMSITSHAINSIQLTRFIIVDLILEFIEWVYFNFL